MPPNNVTALATHEPELPSIEQFSQLALQHAHFPHSHPGSGGSRDFSEHKKDERDDSSDVHKDKTQPQPATAGSVSSSGLLQLDDNDEEQLLSRHAALELQLDDDDDEDEDEDEQEERQLQRSSSSPAAAGSRVISISCSTPRSPLYDYSDAGTPSIPIPPPLVFPAAVTLSPGAAPAPAASSAPPLWKVYIALVLAQLCWSGFHVLGKFTFTFLSPFVLPTLRTIGVVPVFALYAYHQDPQFYIISPRQHLLMVLEGLLGNTIAQQAFNSGVTLSSASLAGMIQPTIPIVTTILAIALKRERMSLSKAAGISLAIAGSLTMVLAAGGSGGDGSVDSSNYTLGAALFLVQCISTSCYIIIQKPMFAAGLSQSSFVFFLFLYGGVGHVIVGAFFLPSVPWSSLPLTLIPILLYVVFIATFVAFNLFVYATNHLPASVSALGITLQSFFSPLLGSLVLGEVITPVDVLGGCLIVAGIVVVVLSKQSEQPKPEPQQAGAEGRKQQPAQLEMYGKGAADDSSSEDGDGMATAEEATAVEVGHLQRSQRVSTRDEEEEQG